MDIFERWFEQDLTKKVGIQHAESLAFSGNNASNVVGVYVYKDGAPAELAGIVTGTVIRPDGMTVPLTGTLSGNAVSAVLTEACFAVPGYIGVALTVTSGDITMTVLKATFEVEPIETGTVVDPSGEITANVAELISDIETAVATIPPSYSDLLAAVAPTFDPEASTPYQSGAYVWYSGALYRFIADHTGAWTGTDAVSVNVGEEISELKSALKMETDRAMTEVSGFRVGEYVPYEYKDKNIGSIALTISPGIIKLSGTSTSGRLMSLLGDEVVYATTSTPSADMLAKGPFSVVAGHTYRLSAKLVSGSISAASALIFTVWATDGTKLKDIYFDNEIKFTPETNTIGQITVYFKKTVTYTDAIIVYGFTDITDELEKKADYDQYKAKVDGAVSEIEDLSAIELGNKIVYGNAVNLPCVSGSVSYGTYAEIEKNADLYKVRGTIISSRVRVPLTGTKIEFSTSTPSKASNPDWYLSSIPDFVLGHSYRLSVKILDGSVDLTNAGEEIYIIGDTDAGARIINNAVDGTVWKCTDLPVMLALVLRAGTYQNAVIYVGVKDITNEKSETEWQSNLNKNPYQSIPWTLIQDVTSVCHAHLNRDERMQAQFEALQSKYKHVAISMYYPSVPTYPLANYFENVGTTIGSPNAEHVRMTGESGHLHLCAVGSVLATNPDSASPYIHVGTLEDTVKNAEICMQGNGGVITINHPYWSDLTVNKILSIMQLSERVAALEVWNASCEMDNGKGLAADLWDGVLSTGNQIYATAVPDHECQYHPNEDRCGFGYNHMIIVNLTEEEILASYRTGRFYTTLYNDGLLLTRMDMSTDGLVTIEVSENSTFLFKTATRSVEVSTAATSATFQTQTGDVYVRVEAVRGTNKLWTNAIML